MAIAAGTDNEFIHFDRQRETPFLILGGDWVVANAAAIEAEAAQLNRDGIGQARIDASKIGRMDTAGAWLLKKYFLAGNAVVDLDDRRKALLDFVPAGDQAVDRPEIPSAFASFFILTGERTIAAKHLTYGILSFIGQIFLCFARNLARPRHLRFPSIVRHILEAGIQALPIIALLGFLMSMVVAYQAAIQLQKFGADLFVIDLTVISMLREMGVLVTAIMVAGRSGSAFAAEIGVMKLREEVDALRTMGMDPIEVLVLPRVIALVIALPLLAFLASLIGLVGGAATALLLLDIPLYQYIDRAAGVATPTMFFVGMIKAPVFAFLIAVIGTYQGMNVTGSAESVGKLTTVAVVQSIFLVILADAFFSIIFAQAGI